MRLVETAPAGEELRRAVYRGEIFRLGPTPATRELAAEVVALLEEELGDDGPYREAQLRRADAEFFQAVGRLRKRLYQESRFLRSMAAVVRDFGFEPGEHAFDPLRLRVSAHEGDANPKAAPVYYAHRDVWYAHPMALVNWWIALHDTTEEEAFEFFPERFRQPVPNNSGDFDYDEWLQGQRSLRIGWQDPNAGRQALYPGFHGSLEGEPRLPFSLRAGQALVFAGAHLHQTRPNRTGRTRFSVDFRTVHLGDHAAGIGAPNVDNRSTGSALQDYLLPERLEAGPEAP